MPDSIVIGILGLTLVVIATVPFVLSVRRREAITDVWEAKAIEEGLHEPSSLHPLINAGECIGTASCVAVCPEGDVIGFRAGQAIAVSPAECIGHGLCERACPVEAIQLVFGTAKRGVDLPRVTENFETNVPGLFVIGELGGMGLIRNAFEQGLQCVEAIAKTKPVAPQGGHQVIVVGCGPAGLSASLACQHHGLSVLTLEREDVGGAVRHYPRKKLVMSEEVHVPGYGAIGGREIFKEELIDVWEEAVRRTSLSVQAGVTVEGVDHAPEGGFIVRTNAGTHRGATVVLAIGRRGVPRKLGIPGEALSNVSYSLLEPGLYRGDRITVVGGGDSAVEAALALAGERGTTVRLSYRRDRLSRVKAANRERLGEAAQRGEVEPFWATEVVENRHDGIVLERQVGGHIEMANDSLFVFAGGELPTPFLKRCGITIDTKFGQP